MEEGLLRANPLPVGTGAAGRSAGRAKSPRSKDLVSVPLDGTKRKQKKTRTAAPYQELSVEVGKGDKVTWLSWISEFLVLDNAAGCVICSVFCLTPIIAALVMFLVYSRHGDLEYITKYSDKQIYTQDGRKIYRVVYFGDSLIAFSDRDYGFVTSEINYLGNLWPKVAFDAYSVGIGGNTVQRLLNRVQTDVVAHHPDCVIVYFDSDASDPTDAGLEYMKIKYEANLRTLLGILTHTTSCVGLGGPTIYGELPRNSGLNMRDDVYDDYVAINSRVAAHYNVTYFRTRDAFFDAIPLGWPSSEGYLTLDGEHHNGAGVAIVSRLFLRFLIEQFTRILGPP